MHSINSYIHLPQSIISRRVCSGLSLYGRFSHALRSHFACFAQAITNIMYSFQTPNSLSKMYTTSLLTLAAPVMVQAAISASASAPESYGAPIPAQSSAALTTTYTSDVTIFSQVLTETITLTRSQSGSVASSEAMSRYVIQSYSRATRSTRLIARHLCLNSTLTFLR